MARFYGHVSGKAKTDASRLGHTTSGLDVAARSFSGSVTVHLFAVGDEDHCSIGVGRGSTTCADFVLYHGPIKQLLEQSTRKTMLAALATETLLDAAE